jgi:phosphomannomutase
MPVQIKFGTDGWRGVIADDFTFDNVKKVALATAHYFKKHKKIKGGVVIGYDARFLSREFAETTATVLGNFGIRAIISDKISSTPMVSFLCKRLNAAGGVVITASHNPAKYNGYKLKGDFGGPAFPEMIDRLEKELKKTIKKPVTLKKTYDDLLKKGTIQRIDFTTSYVNDVSQKIDIRLITSSNLKIAFDAMYGAGMGVMSQLVPVACGLREEFNPSFAGGHPEPLARHLKGLQEVMASGKYDIGIATDGDADRVGAFDEKGNFVDAHRIFALVLKYLYQHKKMTGEVARSFTVSDLIKKMCAKYGILLHTTAVGFKYLCHLMLTRDILAAAEESGGMGVKGHLPERDGIFIGLLLCEMMAARKMKMSELVNELMTEFGWHYFDRIDKHMTEKDKKRILGFYKKLPKKIGNFSVIDVSTIDGTKLFVENGWLLVRASGTEPLIRFYAEADTPEKVVELLQAATSV